MGPGGGTAMSYITLVTCMLGALCWGNTHADWYQPDHRGSTHGYQRRTDYNEYPPSRRDDYDQGHSSYDSYHTKPRRNRPSYGQSQSHRGRHSGHDGNGYNGRHSQRDRHGNYGNNHHGNNQYGSSHHGNNNYGRSHHGNNHHGSSNHGYSNHGNNKSPIRYDSYTSRGTSPRRSDPYTDGYQRHRRRNSQSHPSSSRYNRSSSHKPSRASHHSSRGSHHSSRVSHRPSRPSISHWYKPLSSYGNLGGRTRGRGGRGDRRGYYQASYDMGDKDYYSYKYPSIPEYDYGYSQDTSNFYSYRNKKIACYQCNYRPGKPTWKLVTVHQSVPDPYYPFRYMSVNTRKYVRKQGVSGGWDKCQGALSRRSASKYGVYQDATCEGSCYVRVDKNKMVYRGCYAGEWGVNPHMYGCSYQAGSLYCFCRGDRCNGFMAPNGYTDPYPVGYGHRQQHPYPADYPHTSRYNPYPALQSYHRSHPLTSRRNRRHRYRRDTGGEEEENKEMLAENSVAVYNRLMGSNITGTSNVSGHTDETTMRRTCYSCKAGGGCRKQLTDTRAAAALRVETDNDCYGNCYIRLNSNNGVSRGCYAGEMGVNQHLIGCHVQEDATYCFCRGNLCNDFMVSIVTPKSEAKVDKLDDVAKNVSKEKVTELGAKSTKLEIKEDYPMVLYYIEFPSDD